MSPHRKPDRRNPPATGLSSVYMLSRDWCPVWDLAISNDMTFGITFFFVWCMQSSYVHTTAVPPVFFPAVAVAPINVLPGGATVDCLLHASMYCCTGTICSTWCNVMWRGRILCCCWCAAVHACWLFAAATSSCCYVFFCFAVLNRIMRTSR